MAYEGFKKVEASAKASGVRNPGAVAYAAGRKKYGAKAMRHAAATGKSLKGHRTLSRKRGR